MSSEKVHIEGDAFRYKQSVKTLQYLSAVKISQSLWKGPLSQIALEIFENDCYCDLKSYCKVLFPQIEKKTEKVLFPLIRICVLVDIIQNMSIQIYKWVGMQIEDSDLSKPWELINSIEWNSVGRLDERRTAKNLPVGGIEYFWPADAQDLCFHHFFRNSTLQDVRHNIEIYYFQNLDITFIYDNNCAGCKISSKYQLLKLWNILNEDTKESLLTKKVLDGQNATDIICFILSQMIPDQQVEAFRDHPEYILLNLFSDPAWEDQFFPSLLHFFEYINARTFVALLQLIVNELECNFRPIRNKQLFLTIMQNVPPNLKEKLVEDDWGSRSFYMEELFTTLFQLNLKELYEESILVFFNSPRNINSYFLSHRNCYLLSTKFVFESIDLDKAEKLLRQFIDNDDQLSRCKRSILEEGKPYLSNFWTEGQFEQLDQILSFCFSSDQDEIASFKRAFFNPDNSNDRYDFVDRYMALIIYKIDGLKSLDELLLWIVGDAHDEDTYKKELFRDGKRIVIICLDMLQGCPTILSQQLDDFLKWCFMNDEHVKSFKENLFKELTMEGFVTTFYEIAFWETPDIPEKLIRWLNPSSEMIIDGILNYDRSCPLHEFDSDIYEVLVRLNQSLSLQ